MIFLFIIITPRRVAQLPEGFYFCNFKVVAYSFIPQLLAECVCYSPDAYVPNSPDPSSVQGKIMVWTIRITRIPE